MQRTRRRGVWVLAGLLVGVAAWAPATASAMSSAEALSRSRKAMGAVDAAVVEMAGRRSWNDREQRVRSTLRYAAPNRFSIETRVTPEEGGSRSERLVSDGKRLNHFQGGATKATSTRAAVDALTDTTVLTLATEPSPLMIFLTDGEREMSDRDAPRPTPLGDAERVRYGDGWAREARVLLDTPEGLVYYTLTIDEARWFVRKATVRGELMIERPVGGGVRIDEVAVEGRYAFTYDTSVRPDASWFTGRGGEAGGPEVGATPGGFELPASLRDRIESESESASESESGRAPDADAAGGPAAGFQLPGSLRDRIERGERVGPSQPPVAARPDAEDAPRPAARRAAPAVRADPVHGLYSCPYYDLMTQTLTNAEITLFPGGIAYQGRAPGWDSLRPRRDALDAKKLGRYTRDGNRLAFRWADGRTHRATFHPEDRSLRFDPAYDGVYFGFFKSLGVRPGTPLEAKFTASWRAAGPGGGGASAKSLRFHRDGTFTTESVSMVLFQGDDLRNTEARGREGAGRGRYRFNGYEITFTFPDGRSRTRACFVVDMKPDEPGVDRIWIEGFGYLDL